MNIKDLISKTCANGIHSIWAKDFPAKGIQVTQTRPEFQGDFTLVVFPFTKLGIGNPDEIGRQLGEYLKKELKEVSDFNMVKGFLNISLSPSFWTDWLQALQEENFCKSNQGAGKKFLVEFSSPNTNKPLHLGHLRNIFLGDSISRILIAGGYDVSRVCLYNDRGIAICKSMVMYLREGNGKTPESENLKPDFFVVQFYIGFGELQRTQVAEYLATQGADLGDARIFTLGKRALPDDAMPEEIDNAKARIEAIIKEKNLKIDKIEEQVPVMLEAREMLKKWEAGDEETLSLWKKLNDWVYLGFNKTYAAIGVEFDKYYYESETWKLGNLLVDLGLQKGVFFKQEDGSVWVDLTDQGLDLKVLRRSDGTSVYITQDMGTAHLRQEEFKMDKCLYVVGNEQDYHFKVLRLIMMKLGFPWADGLEHISYGMVDLPAGQGRMKTREGTTVDADHLVEEVENMANEKTRELGKIEGMPHDELEKLIKTVSMGALKYFILRVDPKKKMVFDPNESVNLQGDTGPFIQYTYARIRSVERNAGPEITRNWTGYQPQAGEVFLIRHLYDFPMVLEEAIEELSPSVISAWVLDLAKAYNRFYGEFKILKAESDPARNFRMRLSQCTGKVIFDCMEMLGIQVPERM